MAEKIHRFVYIILQQDDRYNVDCLLTSVNAAHDRISMHGVRRPLLEHRRASIGLPLQTIELPEQPGMQEYEQAMMSKVTSLKNSGYSHAVFGDIFLEDLKRYREEKLADSGYTMCISIMENLHHTADAGFFSIGF